MPKVNPAYLSSQNNSLALCNSDAFWEAVKTGDVQGVDTLYFTDEHLSSQNPEGSTALHLAVIAQKENMVRWLLLQDSPFETPSIYQWTPLHLAARGTSVAIVRYLLLAGANTLAQDSAGWTPLHIAISKQNLPIIKLLILSCPQVVNQVDTKGWTPLHLAANGKNLEIVKLLVKEGADLEALTINQETPFHIANSNNNFTTATWLSTTHQRRRQLNDFLQQEKKIVQLNQHCEQLQDENTCLRNEPILTEKATAIKYPIKSTVKTALPFILFQEEKSDESKNFSEKEVNSILSNSLHM